MPRKKINEFGYQNDTVVPSTGKYHGLLSEADGASFFPYTIGKGIVRINISQEKEKWHVYFSAPKGESLARGTYTGAVRYPQNGTKPGISIFLAGRSCNACFGEFRVFAIRRNRASELVLFEATFTQHAETPNGPKLRGYVYYRRPKNE